MRCCLFQEKIRRSTQSFDEEDTREVALEEPHHPEIANHQTSNSENQIPDTHFIVEESEEIMGVSRRNPCSQCSIQ